MPRRARLFIPDQPQHVVVRGHNRDPILARIEDFRFMYQCLREGSERFAVTIHAWVFMHNHLHLLATPGEVDSLPRCMQSLGRRYAQYFNRTYHRSGALWEGRYKSALIDTENYLLACYRYIELNPVRAGIVRSPVDYPYSSYHANALGKPDPLVTPHPIYLALVSRVRLDGVESDPKAVSSRQAYVDLFKSALSRKELSIIRRGTHKGLGIGQADFLLKVAKLGGNFSGSESD